MVFIYIIFLKNQRLIVDYTIWSQLIPNTSRWYIKELLRSWRPKFRFRDLWCLMIFEVFLIIRRNTVQVYTVLVFDIHFDIGRKISSWDLCLVFAHNFLYVWVTNYHKLTCASLLIPYSNNNFKLYEVTLLVPLLDSNNKHGQ